jgi:hypothetical protein
MAEPVDLDEFEQTIKDLGFNRFKGPKQIYEVIAELRAAREEVARLKEQIHWFLPSKSGKSTVSLAWANLMNENWRLREALRAAYEELDEHYSDCGDKVTEAKSIIASALAGADEENKARAAPGNGPQAEPSGAGQSEPCAFGQVVAQQPPCASIQILERAASSAKPEPSIVAPKVESGTEPHLPLTFNLPTKLSQPSIEELVERLINGRNLSLFEAPTGIWARLIDGDRRWEVREISLRAALVALVAKVEEKR